MKKTIKFLCLVGIVSVAYIAGSNNIFEPTVLNAQDQPEKLSKEEKDRLLALSVAFSQSLESLKESQKYRPAIDGINTFAVSVGGLNAIADLESGNGVDPETFAGLYAGFAVSEISEHLDKDDKGRITYKNKVVQLYSISKLKSLFNERARQFGESVE